VPQLRAHVHPDGPAAWGLPEQDQAGHRGPAGRRCTARQTARLACAARAAHRDLLRLHLTAAALWIAAGLVLLGVIVLAGRPALAPAAAVALAVLGHSAFGAVHAWLAARAAGAAT
jgi:hypothetical protein